MGLGIRAKVNWGDISLTSKFDPLPVKTRRVNHVRTLRLLFFSAFRHFGEVTVGGRKFGSTSGLRFLIQEEVNRFTCGGVFLASAYFRFGDRSKVGNMKIPAFFTILGG